MRAKFLVTGSSGFIGTNVMDFLRKSEKYEVLGIDNVAPKNPEHTRLWKKIDICDRASLVQTVTDFRPDYVIHLAARTDLSGSCVEDYAANTDGVENLLEALDGVENLKHVVFTSSMLVCRVGYQPRHPQDYAPSTYYGESKIQTEKLVREHNTSYSWTLIRPTSIWGPWFGEPYADFFKMVLSGSYVNLGKHACCKTYGYIENAVYQIMSIFDADSRKVDRQVYYIGDYAPYNIAEWAVEIGREAGVRIFTIPFFIFRAAALFGDGLKRLGVRFPMTSFRLKNMTTDNIIDMTATKEIAPCLPVTRKEGNVRTIAWLRTGK